MSCRTPFLRAIVHVSQTTSFILLQRVGVLKSTLKACKFVTSREALVCHATLTTSVCDSHRLDGLSGRGGGRSGGSGGSAVVHAVVHAVGAIGSAVAVGELLRVLALRTLNRVPDSQAKLGRGDVLVAKDKHKAKDRLSDDIENTVEDGLGVRVNDVATLGHTPGDGVEEPDKKGHESAHVEDTANIWAQSLGVRAGDQSQDVDNVEEGEHAEGPVTPLVGCAGKSTNQTGDDHDLISDDSDENGGPWDTGGQEEVEEQERRGDEPVDVANVEDLASAVDTSAVDLGRGGTTELDNNRGLTEVRAHREVGDGGDHGDGSGDVVEEAVRARLGERQAHEGEGGSTHDGADGKVPVRRAVSDLEVSPSSNTVVGVQSLVARTIGRASGLVDLVGPGEHLPDLGEGVHCGSHGEVWLSRDEHVSTGWL